MNIYTTVMHHSLKGICQTMKEKKKIQDLIIAISRKMKKKKSTMDKYFALKSTVRIQPSITSVL